MFLKKALYLVSLFFSSLLILGQVGLELKRSARLWSDGITSVHHHHLTLLFIFEIRFGYVAQTGFQLTKYLVTRYHTWHGIRNLKTNFL